MVPIQALANVLNYLYASEQADYERNTDDPQHIFLSVVEVQDWLQELVDQVHGLT